MKFRKQFWMIATTLMLLVLAGCGGNTPAPTADANALTKQAVFDGGLIGGGFSVEYPESWSQEIGEDGIRLSNNAAVLNTTGESGAFSSGTVAISVSLTPREDAQAFPTAASFLQGFVDLAGTLSNAPTYGTIETTTLDGRDGAKALGTVAGSDNMLLALDLDGNYVFAIIVAPQGEIKNHTEIINAIIASVVLSPAE